MTIYTITEKQNVNSYRRGVDVEAKNLTAAKALATKSQMFHGTVLTIEAGGSLLAVKEAGEWRNIPYWTA